MGRLFGILLILLGIWVGLEVYTEGADRAFGGFFARFSPGGPDPDARTPLERIEDRAEAARDAQLGRLERQLGDLDVEPD